MNISQYITLNPFANWFWIAQADISVSNVRPLRHPSSKPAFDILQPLRQRLNQIQVRNPQLARYLCKLIPAQCPFERDVKFFSCLFHIPPMCKLNPLYEEIVALRFRALCYLADDCGADVTTYY